MGQGVGAPDVACVSGDRTDFSPGAVLCYKPPMATPPRKDNVVRFNKPARPNGTPNGSRPPPRDWRAQLRGREGWLWLAVIVVLAVAIEAWRLLAG